MNPVLTHLNSLLRSINRTSTALMLSFSVLAFNGFGQTVLTISGEVTKPLTLKPPI